MIEIQYKVTEVLSEEDAVKKLKEIDTADNKELVRTMSYKENEVKE